MRYQDAFYDPVDHVTNSLGGLPDAPSFGGVGTGAPVQLWGFEPETNAGLGWELQADGSTATFPVQEVYQTP
jgi:hypothetical protein